MGCCCSCMRNECCCPTGHDLTEWLSQIDEKAIEPELTIIDPHHHLWDPLNEPRGDLSDAAKLRQYMSLGWFQRSVSWIFPKPVLDTFSISAPFFEKYLSQELENDFGGHKVIKSVLIESQFEDTDSKPELNQLKECKNRFNLSLQNKNGFPHAMVCHIDLCMDANKIQNAINAYKSVNPNIVGVRHQLAYHESNQIFTARDAKRSDYLLSTCPSFRIGMKVLQHNNLSFEVYLYHTQLVDFAKFAQQFPDMKFCLNHFGQPLGYAIYASTEKRESALNDWKRDLEKVANSNENIYLKLSGGLMPCVGFGFEKQDLPPNSKQVADALYSMVSYAIEIFTIDRCMFASNFPVDKVSCSYVVLYNAYKIICHRLNLSDENKAKLFEKNAAHFYKL